MVRPLRQPPPQVPGLRLDINRLSNTQAAELGGRLAWACNALFGRCGRAFLVPILRRPDNPKSRWRLNRRLRRALRWWRTWLASPPPCLTRHVPAAPRRDDLPPALLYTDASTDFGLGAVLLLPLSWEALFLRVRAPGARIDVLEVEAVLAADFAFG